MCRDRPSKDLFAHTNPQLPTKPLLSCLMLAGVSQQSCLTWLVGLETHTTTVCSVVKFCAWTLNTALNRLFIYYTFLQPSSWSKCQRKFYRKYPESTRLCKASNYKTVTKLHPTGLVLERKISWKNTKEVVDIFWLFSGKKYKFGTHLLKLQSHKSSHTKQFVSKLWSKNMICRWFQEWVFNGLLHPEFTFYSNDACYTLSGYAGSQIKGIMAQKTLKLSWSATARFKR